MHRILDNLNCTLEWYTGIKGLKLKYVTEKNQVVYYAYNFTIMQMGVLTAIANQAFIVAEIDKKKITKNGYLPIITNIGFVLKEDDRELKHQLKEIFYLNPTTETIYTEMQVEGEITRTDLLRIKKAA
jgi:hypothetical protein